MRRLPPLLLVLSVLALLTLAACAGAAAAPSGVASLDTPNPEASATPSASVDPEEALLAFTQCMRDNGVDLPDPGVGQGPVRVGGEDGLDPEAFQAANEACRHHLAGVISEEGPQLGPEQRDAMLAFARCMRERGIDMPDPGDHGFLVPADGDPEAPDFDDPEFRAAEEACRHHLGDMAPEPAGPGLPAGGSDQ